MCDLDGYGMTLTCHRVTRIVALRISGVGSATLLSAFDTRELGGYFANVATQPARTTFASSKSQDGQPRLGIKTWVACRRRQILYSQFVRWNDECSQQAGNCWDRPLHHDCGCSSSVGLQRDTTTAQHRSSSKRNAWMTLGS